MKIVIDGKAYIQCDCCKKYFRTLEEEPMVFCSDIEIIEWNLPDGSKSRTCTKCMFGHYGAKEGIEINIIDE